MKRTNLFISLTILALLVTMLACNLSFSSAKIDEAWMAFDQEGTLRTTVYDQDDLFYAIVLLGSAPNDTVVKAVFIAVDAEGEEPNTRIDDAELISGDRQLYFTLSNPALWPPGIYKVDLYLNGEYNQALEFQVQSSVAPTPEPAPTPAGGQPVITTAFTSRDEEGSDPTTVFNPADIFYALVETANAPPDTVVGASWFAVSVEGFTPNHLIDTADVTGGDGSYTFQLTGNQAWPAGDYKVELSLNGVLAAILDFEVREAAPPAGNISTAYLSRDETGAEATTTFSPLDIFYCIVEVVNASADVSIQANWHAVAVLEYETNALLHTDTITGGNGPHIFELFSDQAWPLGDYRVDLFVDGLLQMSLEFTVQ